MDTNIQKSNGIIKTTRRVLGITVLFISVLFFLFDVIIIIPFVPIIPHVPESSWNDVLPYSGIPIWDWPGYTLLPLISDTRLFPINILLISLITAIILFIIGYFILGEKVNKSV
jgi:hypothetical protein